MARNVRIVTGVPGQIERQQELADALTVRALRSRVPQQGGPVQVKMSPWEGVAQLGEAWIARKARGKADDLARADMERQKAANEAMIRQLAGEQGPRRLTEQGQPTGDPIEAPLDMETGRPMLLSNKAQTLAAAMSGMDPYQSGNALGGAMMQQALATPKYDRVDLGDSIGVVDERGQVIHRIPKNATPDTRVREAGANARHAAPSGSAQLGAQTTMRGQDISAGTAMRGQDLSNENARLARETAAGTRNVAQERLDLDRARYAREDREQAANRAAQTDKITKMQDEIDGLLSAPGFDTVYGKSRFISPGMLPGGEGANAETRRNQLDAASFGIAIQDMRGLGALSNAEGLKVSSAFTRATDPRQSEDEARIAWAEVKSYLDLAKQRLESQSSAMAPPGATQPGVPPSPFGMPPVESRVGSYYD